jgi:hypothetical protein
MFASVVSVATDGLGRDDGYLFCESRSEYPNHHMHPDPKRVWVSTQPEHRQIWRGPDGSGLIREESGPPRFFDMAGRLRWEVAGSPALPSGLHQTVMAPGCMDSRRSQQRAARLPIEPAALRVAITRGPPGDRLPAEEEFSAIVRLLRTPEAPIDLSAGPGNDHARGPARAQTRYGPRQHKQLTEPRSSASRSAPIDGGKEIATSLNPTLKDRFSKAGAARSLSASAVIVATITAIAGQANLLAARASRDGHGAGSR